MFESIDTALGMLVIYLLNEWRKNHKEIKERKQKLQSTVNDSDKIYPIIRRLLNNYKASRVCIVQFHNGEKYYSGKHIQRMSMSHEVTDQDNTSISESFTDILIDESAHTVISGYSQNDFYSMDDTSLGNNYKLKEVFKIYDIKSFYSLPLKDRQGNIMGQLNFNFNRIGGLSEYNGAEIQFIKNEIQKVLNG